MSIASTWRFNWLGFKECNMVNAPSVYDFQDPNWTPSDLDLIVKYLDSCPGILWSQDPMKCVFCDKIFSCGSFYTDGIMRWRSYLPHYVQHHHVRLPDFWVEEIRKQKYQFAPVVGRKYFGEKYEGG